MALSHDEIQIGDRVYSPHHSRFFLVEKKDSQNLLLSPEGNSRDPQRLVSAVGGLHWGLQSYAEYKKFSKQLDQLAAMPRYWR